MSDPVIIDKHKPGTTAPDDQEKLLNREEKLETGLEDSMDASDPPATTAPGDHGDPVPSSGFSDEDSQEKPGEKPGQ